MQKYKKEKIVNNLRKPKFKLLSYHDLCYWTYENRRTDIHQS